jgi:hypothetical protein
MCIRNDEAAEYSQKQRVKAQDYSVAELLSHIVQKVQDHGQGDCPGLL